MPSQPDYYATLEVSETASPEVITSAYRSLARKFHPDANPSPEANARMKAINAAYDVLGDRNKRAAYDRQRVAAKAKPAPPPYKPPSPPPQPAAPPTPVQTAPASRSTFDAIRDVLVSQAAGIFVIAFIIALVAFSFITDAFAPQISEEGLVLLAVIAAAIATWVIRRARP